MQKEVDLWWKQAKRDLRAAKKNYQVKYYYVALFLSQQAVEKALKTLWLKEMKTEIPRYHNLSFFYTQLNLPPEFKSTCDDLSGIYITARYPSDKEIKFSYLFSIFEILVEVILQRRLRRSHPSVAIQVNMERISTL